MKHEDFIKEFFGESTGPEQMSYSEFIKENFDVPTLLGQLKYADIVLEGIGGSLPVRLYGETDAVLSDAAESLDALANDERANMGLGVLPETICGAVEVIERLRALPPDEYAIAAFYEDGWGWEKLPEVYMKIMSDPLFRIICDFSDSILVHERTGREVILPPYEDTISRLVRNARDFIVYQTENTDEPQASSVLALMIMKK